MLQHVLSTTLKTASSLWPVLDQSSCMNLSQLYYSMIAHLYSKKYVSHLQDHAGSKYFLFLARAQPKLYKLSLNSKQYSKNAWVILKKKRSAMLIPHIQSAKKNNANFASIYNNATKKCNSRVHQKISISKSLKNKKKENLYSYTYIHYYFRILKKRAQMPAIPLISHSMLRRL